MLRNSVLRAAAAIVFVLSTAVVLQASQYGAAEEARAMLDKAVAAVKADKTKALNMLNQGEGGFKDRDLYVFCANASDSVVHADDAHKGAKLKDIKDATGFAFGEEVMTTATERKVSEVAYLWPRPGSDTPVQKVTLFTKAGDQICAVGYYK